jgi:hypothetical protein
VDRIRPALAKPGRRNLAKQGLCSLSEALAEPLLVHTKLP